MKVPAFDLLTYTKSNTAMRNGIDNTPSPEEIENLKKIHKHIIRFIWKYVCIPKGKHLVITSGYRCEKLNKMVKGQNAPNTVSYTHLTLPTKRIV